MAVANARRASRSQKVRDRMVGLMTSRGLGLFAETIVVSLAVSVLSLPAVTALPALAAGSAHLRRHTEGESDSLVGLWRDFLRALRHGWVWGILSAVAVAAIAFTITSPAIAFVPGGDTLKWVSVIVGIGVTVVLLRSAAAWTPEDRWSDLLRESAQSAARDASGSLLLVLALGLCFMVVWMFAPLIVLVPGMLVLAARAVDARKK